MTNNSGFGAINNCNSLNIGVVSSPTVNSIRSNSFYKLTNVLLLLFLVFGSCVVSFGMNTNEDEKTNQINEPKEDDPVYIAPRDRYYLGVPSIINKISMLFLTNVMGVKGEDIKKDKVEKEKEWVNWFTVLGLNESPDLYEINNKQESIMFFFLIS